MTGAGGAGIVVTQNPSECLRLSAKPLGGSCGDDTQCSLSQQCYRAPSPETQPFLGVCVYRDPYGIGITTPQPPVCTVPYGGACSSHDSCVSGNCVTGTCGCIYSSECSTGVCQSGLCITKASPVPGNSLAYDIQCHNDVSVSECAKIINLGNVGGGISFNCQAWAPSPQVLPIRGQGYCIEIR